MNNVFDFSIVTNWIHQMLTSLMPEGLAIFLECVVIGVCIILMYAVLAIILIYVERKYAPSSNAASVRCAWGNGDCSKCPATSSRC